MNLSVGAWGWKHPEWEKDVFYPDDLPVDWQLSYYSNEFDVVVVPATYWGVEGYDEEDWLDDVEDDFGFYIEWPFLQLSDIEDYKKCVQACTDLGKQLSAILVNNKIWSDLTQEQQQWFNELTKNFKVRQFGTGASVDEYDPVIDDQLDTEKPTDTGVLLLHTDMTESLRELSPRLSKILNSSEIKDIILSTTTPDIERMKELVTLVDLFA